MIASIAERVLGARDSGLGAGDNGALLPHVTSPHRLAIAAQHGDRFARRSPPYRSRLRKAGARSTARSRNFRSAAARFTSRSFATPDGRARLHVHELPELLATGDGELRLMTIRSEGQFNTVVYEDEDIYRGVDRRDVILLHPDDLGRLQLTDGDRVTVHGPAGIDARHSRD